MKRLYWRTENVLLAFAQMLYWIYTGCESHPKMACCGNTVGCHEPLGGAERFFTSPG